MIRPEITGYWSVRYYIQWTAVLLLAICAFTAGRSSTDMYQGDDVRIGESVTRIEVFFSRSVMRSSVIPTLSRLHLYSDEPPSLANLSVSSGFTELALRNVANVVCGAEPFSTVATFVPPSKISIIEQAVEIWCPRKPLILINVCGRFEETLLSIFDKAKKDKDAPDTGERHGEMAPVVSSTFINAASRFSPMPHLPQPGTSARVIFPITSRLLVAGLLQRPKETTQSPRTHLSHPCDTAPSGRWWATAAFHSDVDVAPRLRLEADARPTVSNRPAVCDDLSHNTLLSIAADSVSMLPNGAIVVGDTVSSCVMAVLSPDSPTHGVVSCCSWGSDVWTLRRWTSSEANGVSQLDATRGASENADW